MCRIWNGFVLVVLCGLTLVTAAQPAIGSMTTFMRLDEVAEDLHIVIWVRVYGRRVWDEHMTLKNGTPGPVVCQYVEYDCRAISTLVGSRALDPGTPFTVRSSHEVPVEYDDQGKVVLSYFPILPGSGIEMSLQEDAEYLLCFAYLDPAAETHHLMRAEPIQSRLNVLAAIAQAKAWGLLEERAPRAVAHVLLACFDPCSCRTAFLVQLEGEQRLYIADGLSEQLHYAVVTGEERQPNQLYFDDGDPVLRHNRDEPTEVPVATMRSVTADVGPTGKVIFYHGEP